MALSIIVPMLNEAAALPGLLAQLARWRTRGCEVVVVDGGSTDGSAAMARAFGGYGERITKVEDIVPAIKRGIEQTKKGVPVLLEFITSAPVVALVAEGERAIPAFRLHVHHIIKGGQRDPD